MVGLSWPPPHWPRHKASLLLRSCVLPCFCLSFFCTSVLIYLCSIFFCLFFFFLFFFLLLCCPTLPHCKPAFFFCDCCSCFVLICFFVVSVMVVLCIFVFLVDRMHIFFILVQFWDVARSRPSTTAWTIICGLLDAIGFAICIFFCSFVFCVLIGLI